MLYSHQVKPGIHTVLTTLHNSTTAVDTVIQENPFALRAQNQYLHIQASEAW